MLISFPFIKRITGTFRIYWSSITEDEKLIVTIVFFKILSIFLHSNDILGKIFLNYLCILDVNYEH